ncbi:MAG TPA: BamA/TamA family outer membrane protein [Longimicrobiales bacterium]|nr:BamA/TamA family outer membrane protein [Longimicrobiales bacterium]
MPLPRLALALALAAALLLRPSALHAQAGAPDRRERPPVYKITFKGNAHVSEDLFDQSIATQPTRCRSIFYAPICLVSSAPVFKERHFLDREELARDALRIRVIYWRYGYRHATVRPEVKPHNDGVDITFVIDEGPPTILRAVRVTQTDSVLSRRDIRRARLPRRGRPVDLFRVDTARTALRDRLWDRGYGDGVVTDTVVLRDSLNAALLVTLAPGKRTTIDTVEVHGNREVTERTVRRLVDLRPGQPYRRTDVLEAQRRLYQSELFRQAVLTVPETADSSKTVIVSVREAPLTSLRFGAGMNTTEFGQVQATVTRYNWIGTARRVDLQATVANLLAPQLFDQGIFGSAVPRGVSGDVRDAYLQPTWLFSLQVSQPWLWSTRNSLAASIFTQRRSIPGIVIDRGYGTQETFTRRLAPRTAASLTYRFEQTRVEAGELYFCVNFGICRLPQINALRGRHRLSPLWLNVTADRADDPLAPSTGYTGHLDVEHASALTASDFRYNRAAGDYARYVRVGSGVLAARLRAGWIRALSSTAGAVGVDTGTAIIHPRKQFYAGGARSVRGYGENQLGPRVLTVDPAQLVDPDNPVAGFRACTPASVADGTCDPNVVPSTQFLPRPLGGQQLIEGSVEYRMPLGQTLIGAVFVDAGSVSDPNLRLASPNRVSAVTPGFGVRYHSPIGPIRIDLGVRPLLVENLTVYTQAPDSSGALRIVQLQTPKHYDPLEGRSGLGRLLARLQLHLAIGEAF